MKEFVKKAKLLDHFDVEKITITKDHYFQDAYLIDFPLDSTPDHVWQDLFEREWKLSKHLWDRKLFVIGNKLRLVTSLRDIEEKIDWVKEVVDLTNMRVDEYNKEMEAREVQAEEVLKKQVLEDSVKIEEIRNILRQRFTAA
ncbi:MAG: hypothetical protein ACPL0C_05025 [Candidatus Bathyarchaeales archaeon]